MKEEVSSFRGKVIPLFSASSGRRRSFRKEEYFWKEGALLQGRGFSGNRRSLKKEEGLQKRGGV